VKSRKAENLSRSGYAPLMSAGVMAAKVPWKRKKRMWGSVPLASCPTSFMNRCVAPPMSPPWLSPKASE